MTVLGFLGRGLIISYGDGTTAILKGESVSALRTPALLGNPPTPPHLGVDRLSMNNHTSINNQDDRVSRIQIK